MTTVKGVQNLFGRFLSILSARVLTTIVAVVSTPIVVRLLGPGGYGDYAVLLSIFSLYMVPVSGFITQGVQKFVAERREAPGWRENVVRVYGLLAVGIVVVAALLLVAVTATGVVETLFGAEFAVLFYLLAAYVFVSQFRALSTHAVLGFGLEHVSGPLDVTRKVFIVTVGIGLVLSGFGVAGMLVGHIAANVVVALVASYVVLRRVSVRSLLRPVADGFPHRELLSYNALNVVLVLLLMSLYHVDIVMLRALAGNSTTGFYKGALALAEYLWAVPKVLETVLLHSSSTLWSDGRREEITDLASRVTRYTVLLVGLLAVGLASLAETFVPLYYGEPFVVATAPLLVLLPGAIGFAAARPLRAVSQGSGRITALIVATGAAAALNLGLNALLIPRFGMLGAAAATSVGYGSMFVLLVWAARRIGYDPLEDFRGARIAATIVAAAPPMVLVSRAIEHDLLALLVVPPFGLVLYCGVAVATGAIDPAELRSLAASVPDPFGSAIEASFARVL